MSNKILLNIINDVLDFAQMESGDFQLNFDKFSLKDLLLECSEIICEDARSKNINIVLEIDRDLPSSIFSDQQRVRQVLLNLLVNAVKFTPLGQIKIIASHLDVLQ